MSDEQSNPDVTPAITGEVLTTPHYTGVPRGCSNFSQDIVDEIDRRMSAGEPLDCICRTPGMPARRTVDDWRKRMPEVDKQLQRAREEGEDAIAADCLAIADDGRNDWMERLGPDGQGVGWQLNGEHSQRSKLRVWTRLQLLAKWNPRKWGEKVAHQALDENGEPTRQTIIVIKDGVRV